MKITVVNKKTYPQIVKRIAERGVESAREPWEVYIGRPTVLGNPYTIGRDGSRDSVVDAYEIHARTSIAVAERAKDLTCIETRFKKELIRLNRLLKEHGKLTLICWCAPLRCHGDVIKKILYEWNNLTD